MRKPKAARPLLMALLAPLALLAQATSASAETAAALPGPGEAPAHSGKIALTFDDLPGLTLFANQQWVDYFNTMLLRAIGFVNEGKFDEIERDHQIANVQQWCSASAPLAKKWGCG